MHGHRSGDNFMSHMFSDPAKGSFKLLLSPLILAEAEADSIVYKIGDGRESWKSRSIKKILVTEARRTPCPPLCLWQDWFNYSITVPVDGCLALNNSNDSDCPTALGSLSNCRTVLLQFCLIFNLKLPFCFSQLLFVPSLLTNENNWSLSSL